MSVKMLCHDAKGYLEQKTKEWRDRHDYAWRPEIKELIRQTQLLIGRSELWEKTHPPDPSMLRAPSDTMHSIFGKKIKGLVVICYNAFFEVTGLYSDEEAKLLVANKVRKLRGEVDYLKFRKDVPAGALDYERLPIPENVRNEVWRRDQGKCVRCGSVRNLEFDHIIPVIKGGSNTARNIQLLCEACNRQKSANIG